MEKNRKVSMVDPMSDETRGATNQIFFLNLWNTWTSSNCAIKNAKPEPAAILFDIKFEKSVEKYKVKNKPRTKPK